MKKSWVASLLMGGLVLVTANSAFATATASTNVTTMSADNAATGGSGAYTTVTGPVLTEGSNHDITNGTIILTVSTNFQFNSAATVSVSVTRGSGTSNLVGLSSGTAIVTTSNITITVTNQDGGATTTSILTWSGIQARPLFGTPLATNTLTMSTASTANILGITKGTTSFGQLRETLGAANKLTYTTPPAATNTAGVALTNVVVQVQDRFGNTVSSNNVAIALALNTGAFASGNTNANTGVGGSATFSNLVIDTAGSYSLTATAPATSLSNSLPTAFSVVSATPSALQILQDAPSSIFSGVIFPSNVTIQVTDAFANLISNQTVNLSLLSGAPLSGTTSQPSAGNGVATFGGLSVAQSGSQSLVASISSPSLSVTGTAFTVNAGFASQLGYTTAPAAVTTAGVTMASVVVQIQDQAGNSIASNGVPITVTLNTGTFTSGTTTVLTAPNGSATFSDLVINTSGSYTLTASAAGTTFTSTPAASFTIVAATPSVIQITQDAPSSTTAGTVFSPAVTVLLMDSLNNPVPNTTVTLSLLNGGTLNGTLSQATAVNGVASFPDLNITLAGVNYALVATSVNSLSATGNTFTVTTAAASKLVYTTVPAITNTAGGTLTAFTVQITDPFGNAIPTNGVAISMGLSSGTFASGTTTSNSDVNGSAGFSDLVITNAGNNTLTASASGLTSANSPLVILPTAYAITFQQDAPSPATAGVTFSPPVAVRIADQYNNFLTNKAVTLTLLPTNILGGTLVRTTAVNGVASFANLSINVAGTNYTLVANSVNSLSVTGNTFAVNTASPSKLVFTSVPAVTNVAGSTLSSFGIQIQDPFNNNVLTNGVLITMTLSNGTFASGTTSTNSDVNGSASIGDLVITNAGNNVVTASAAGLTSTNKSLVILPAPFAITFQQDAPSITNAGALFSPPVAVKIADQYNNFLTNKAVTLTLLPTNILGGTLVRTTAVNGVASFTNLFINTAGTNYALVANSTNSLSVTGNTFVVTAATATKLLYTVLPPTSTVAGVTLTPFTLQVADQFNNSVATSNVPIAMSLSNSAFASGTTLSNSDVNGSASFNDLVVTNAGNRFLVASAPGLTSTNRSLVVLPAPYAITFQQDAPSITNAGAVFTPPVAVKIADQYNNVLSNRTVTLSLNGGGPLNGTTSASTATNGVASFSNLNITAPGTNYALVANYTNSLSVTGQTFTVTTGPPSKLVYTTLPPLTNTAGVVLSTFVVQIEDSVNNSIATNGVPIAVGLNTGSFASGTTNQTSDLGGKATFFDLYIDTIGTYTLSASSTGLAPVAQLITIVPTNASNIAFIQQPPVSVIAGTTFSPSVTVKVTDQFNNAIAGLPVLLSLNGAATLNGTTSQVTSASGVATFSNLSVNQHGTGYYLTAITTNPALSATSSNFNVNVGAINHYLVTTNSSPLVRATPFSVTVTAQDVVSNTVPDNSTVVTMSGSTANVQFDANGDLMYGDNTQTLSNGTFSINTRDFFPENITITAKDASNRTGSISLVVNAVGGDFRSAANGNWSLTNTWQTWNGTSWVGATTTPAGGAGTNITIQSFHTVTNNVAVGLTGMLITQGTLNFSSGGSVTASSGGIVMNSGTINSSATTLIFNSGGIYAHAYTNASGTVPTSAWNSNSTCAIVGYTTYSGTAAGLGQSFNNFLWNCPNQSAAISEAGSLTMVNGNFTIANTGSGSFQGSSNAVFILTVAGDVNIQGGTFVPSFGGNTNLLKIGGSFLQTGGTFSQGAGTLTLNFTGANKTFTLSGGTFNNFNVNFAVTNGASLTLNNSLSVSNGQSFTVLNSGTLNCGTNVVGGAGAFALNSGGGLGIGSPSGITSSGATGNVQTTTRTFNPGGVYIYNGSASQATGSGLPATASSLIVSNTGGIVTLGANVSITSNLTVSAGVFDLGGFNANRATSGGTLTVASGAALNIGGANPFPTNYATVALGASSTVQYEGSSQNVSALPYGNLNTSGSGIKTLLAGPTTLAGDLNIGAGTTFDAVTNSFSIAGNLTNNGSAFSFRGPQTVTFNGSIAQNVAGTSPIAFNTVTINSGSVLNLANNDTALALIITNVSQGSGSWGASGSGATTIDDTDFQGTATLTVTPPTFGFTFLQDAPAVTNAGAVFSPAVVVQLTSSATNLIASQTVTLTLNGGGVLGGTASQLTDTNGLATFSNLSVNAAGTNYSLTATITGLSLSVTGNTFVVTTAPATKLVYTSVPSITNSAGGTLTSFTVQIEDQFNNNVPGSGVPITMSLASGTFASGTPVMNSDVNGTATFSDLVITNAGNNTLTASAAGLTSANTALVVLPATYAITFQQDAPSPATAGVTFSPPVAVKIADQYNNVLSNKSVTLSLLGGATLNGTLSRTTTNTGVATFTNLTISVAGTNNSLVATITSPSLSVTGNTFTVTTAPASKLIYTVLPPASTVAGATLTPFTVQIADQFNNSIATNGVPISMTLSNGAFASGTTSSNSDVNGSASFSDLVITNAGINRLIASASGLTSSNRIITVTPDVANATITFLQGPAANISAGVVFTNTVQLVDEFNNGLSNTTVTLTPNGFAVLNGTLSHATAGNGVATFNNLSVTTPGSNYFITATSGSLSTNSSTFNVTAGAIARYVVTASSPQTRGVPFPVTVTAQDAVSNTVPDSTTVVTMRGSTLTVVFDGTGDSSFTNNTQVLSNGTFTINSEDGVAETNTITASDATGKTGTSSAIVVNAAGGDYRSAQTGPWSNTNTWQTWNGSSWVTASVPPAGGAGTNITIQSTHRVTNNVAVALSGTLITQGSLTFSAGGSMTVGAGSLVMNSGVLTNTTASTLVFNSGAIYLHNFATTAGFVPIAAWDPNSTCEMIGYTTLDNSGGTPVIGGLNQAFGNFTWNCLTQSGTVTAQGSLSTVNGNFTLLSSGTGFLRLGNNGTGDLAIAQSYLQTGGKIQLTAGLNRLMTVGGDFSLGGGSFDLTAGAGHGLLNVAGNFTHTSGTLTESGTTTPFALVVFNGTGIQNYTSGGTVSGAVNFNVSNNATLFMGTNLLGSGSTGTFTLSAGATLGIGDPLGITTSGASGNIRVSGTRTYNTTANYIYNGPASQVTSNGLPATVNSVTVSNTGGIVTLGSNVSVTSNLTVSAGTFDLGNFTADRASNGGTITVANGAALNIGGANLFPANYASLNLGTNSTVEYEGSAQDVAALAYGNLNTSGSGTKTLLAGSTALAGDLSIGAGTTFDAGTNDFSIAGDWSNNGNGFTATNSQTVTFNGSSPQTIDGSFATTFNNVAINSGSVLDLAINGSTAQLLTIAGVNQPVGTWGATGSGAANIDDVDFQGTGTLNVLSALTGPSTTTVATSGSPSTYGQSVTFTASVTGTGPTPSGTVTFMAGADTLGTQVVSGSPTATAAFVTSGLLPGSYTITAVYGGDANFLASSNSVAQQVNPGPITVMANSTTKTYGQTVTFAGTEFSTSGTLVGGDSVTSVTLTSDGAPAGAAAGIHIIIPSAAVGTGLTNYIISYQNGTLTVNQAPVTGSITASNKVYDGTTAATIASYGLSAVVGTDDVTLTGGTANFSDGTVGNGKTVTATGLTLAGFTAGNYFLTSSNASTTADITPAALTIIADNKTKTAGLPNPTLTATYVGFVNGENTNALTTPPTLSTTAIDSSPAGTYSITASDAVATNYTISYTDGTLTVAEVPQISNAHVSGNQFIFSFPTLSNEEYQVEFKDNLSAPTWTNSDGLIDGTGSSITVTNAITGAMRFYRVEVSPGN